MPKELMEDNKEYYAFISYKREDEKWAKWLQHKLEHYRLPSNLNGRTDLPREIRPVFRDVSDLNPGVLGEEIDNALLASQWLIVVCSPRSAQSDWVCKEAQTFIDLGRSDRIIPFIIEGTPFSGDKATECYPEALLSLSGTHELLGTNVSEMGGRDAAAIKIIARMFGLRFDTLWRRYEREQKRRRAWIIAAVTAFVLAVLGIAVWIGKLYIDKNSAFTALTEANKETKREMERAVKAEKGLSIANDSLAEAKDSLQIQYDLIEQTNDSLHRTIDAKSLAQSRAAAKMALECIEDGDSYLARKIAASAYKISPTPEAEYALRKASESDFSVLYGHSKPVNYSSFSADGTRVVSASKDSTIKIWNTMSGKCIRTLRGHLDDVNCVVFSPNNNLIASASDDKTIKIWDPITGKCIYTFNEHEGVVTNLSFNHTGDLLASSSIDKTIRIWSIKDGVCIDTLVGHSNWVSDVCFFPKDDRLVSVSWDKTVRVWEDGVCVRTLYGHTTAINSVAVNKHNNIISAAHGKIALWDINQNRCIDSVDCNKILPTITMCSDGIHMAAPSGKIVKIYKVIDGKITLVSALYGFRGEIQSAVFNKSANKVVASLNNHLVQLIDCAGEQFEKKNHNLLYSITNLTRTSLIAFNVDGKNLVAIDESLVVRMFNTSDFMCTDSVLGGRNMSGCSSIIFNKNGNKFYVFSELALKEYSINNLRCTDSIIANFGKCGTISPNGRFYARSLVKKVGRRKVYCIISIIDRSSRDIIKILDGHKDDILNVSFSNDGETLATLSKDKTIRIWNVSDGKCKKIIPLLANGYNMAFDSDSKFLAVSVNQLYELDVINIYNVKTGKLLQSLKGHMGGIESIRFSSDGKYIVSASDDKTTKVWDVTTGICVQTFKGSTQWVRNAIFGPNDYYIASSSADGIIRIWDFPPIEELIRETHRRFKDNPLTPEERRKYYLE